MFAYYRDLVNIVAFCDTQMGAQHTLQVLKDHPDVPRYQDFRKMLEEKGNLSPAQQLTYDMVTKGASNVSMENLQGVIDWYQQNK